MQLGLRPTEAGLAEITAALREGRKITFSQMVLGDALGAWYDTTGLETALKNERWRGAVTDITPVDGYPNRMQFEAHPDGSGWTVREFGLISSTGILMAIGMHQVLDLPAPGTQLLEITIQAQLDFVDAGVVAIQVDPIVLASRAYVDDTHGRKMATETEVGHTQLATAAETLEGMLNSKAVHPAGLQSALDALHQAILGGATPEALDTIRELAEAFKDDAGIIDTILNMLGQKADLTALSNHLASNDPHPGIRGQRYFFGQI